MLLFLINKFRFTVNTDDRFWSKVKFSIMDTQIANWEMAIEAETYQVPSEELATGPSEPYKLDTNSINWN
jgi:hypothetical protein